MGAGTPRPAGQGVLLVSVSFIKEEMKVTVQGRNEEFSRCTNQNETSCDQNLAPHPPNRLWLMPPYLPLPPPGCEGAVCISELP